MKNFKHAVLLTITCATLSGLIQPARLKHPKMQMLDHAFAAAPKGVDQIIDMKRVVTELQKELDVFTSNRGNEVAFLEGAKTKLLDTGSCFLERIYTFKVMVEPLVKESLMALADDGVDPDDAFVLYRFFSIAVGEVGTYFYDAIETVDDLQQTLTEFSTLTDDLLKSFSKQTKDRYKLWKKEQQTS